MARAEPGKPGDLVPPLFPVGNSGQGYLSRGWAQGRKGQTEEGEGHREGLWSSVGRLKARREGM